MGKRHVVNDESSTLHCDSNLRIYITQSPSKYGAFRLAKIRFCIENLPGQVRKFDNIIIDQMDMSYSASCQTSSHNTPDTSTPQNNYTT